VASYVVDGDAKNLRGFLELSSSVAVLLYFHTSRAEQSGAMLAELERLTLAAAGKALLVRVDADAQPELVQALGVTGLPSLIAVLKNQPAPLFSATVATEQLEAIFTKVLEVAASNGIDGTLQLAEGAAAEVAATTAKPLSANLVAGFEAMEAGEFDKAIASFETELNTNPAAEEPRLAIEQARFLQRLATVDIDATLKASKSSTIAETLALADANFAAVSPAAAFDLLLTRFAIAEPAERDLIRARLISYFELAGSANPDVAAARVRLANLLF
jgi:putative thioredoxin